MLFIIIDILYRILRLQGVQGDPEFLAIFPERGCRHACNFPELRREVLWAAIAQQACYLRKAQLIVHQKLFGAFDALQYDVFLDGQAFRCGENYARRIIVSAGCLTDKGGKVFPDTDTAFTMDY